jgi:hypothetical protein
MFQHVGPAVRSPRGSVRFLIFCFFFLFFSAHLESFFCAADISRRQLGPGLFQVSVLVPG